MSISKRTVERHVSRLMDAIAIRDRATLVRFAFEHGICGL
jgi:DNA-binding NarL/FixJ family response regulator